MIPTPHIEVKDKGIIAETVLLPGDPRRAKFIAENYLESAAQFNSVRNIFGYTGIQRQKGIGHGHRRGDALQGISMDTGLLAVRFEGLQADIPIL